MGGLVPHRRPLGGVFASHPQRKIHQPPLLPTDGGLGFFQDKTISFLAWKNNKVSRVCIALVGARSSTKLRRQCLIEEFKGMMVTSCAHGKTSFQYCWMRGHSWKICTKSASPADQHQHGEVAEPKILAIFAGVIYSKYGAKICSEWIGHGLRLVW